MSKISIIKIILCFFLIILSECVPASSSQYLAESDHPYGNNYDNTWTIEEPGAHKIKLHFEYLKLARGLNNWGLGDKLIISDKYGDELETIESVMGISYENYWTNWYPGDKLQIRLVTDDSKVCDGFIIDKDMVSNETASSFGSEDASKSSQYLAESDHPYANNYDDTWTIEEPGASEIRIHFKDLRLAKTEELPNYDELLILDRYGNVVETYGMISGFSKQDFWTNWYKGDKLTIELATDKKRSCYGFVVDKKDFKTDESITSDSKTAEPTKTQSSSTSYTETGSEDSNNKDSSSEDSSNEDSSNILTSIKLISSANPSTFGNSVALTAEVNTSSQATKKPSGTVTFMDGTMPIGTENLISGQAILATSSLSSGTHSITAQYNGDSNFKSSTSPPFTLTIQEQSSTEQNSLVGDIIALVSQNALISTIVGGLIVSLIMYSIEKKQTE
jgi:hypothetical protein